MYCNDTSDCKRIRLDDLNSVGADLFDYIDEASLSDVSTACIQGSTSNLKSLLTAGRSVDTCDNRGNTSLHIAALRGSIECCKLLLNHAKLHDLYDTDQINALSHNGVTPLMFAVQNNSIELVEFLFLQGACPNFVDGEGNSCLDRALDNDNEDIFKYLLKNTNPNICSFEGWTTAHACAKKGNIIFLETLLNDERCQLKPTECGITPLHIACQEGHLQCVQLLIKHPKSSVESKAEDGTTPIFIASQNGYSEILRLLIDQGANVNVITDNGTVLHSAVIGGNIECLKLLLENGSDVEGAIGKTSVDTPLSQAVFTSDIASVEILLQYGADPLLAAPEPHSSAPLHLIMESIQLSNEIDFDSQQMLVLILPKIANDEVDAAVSNEIVYIMENSDNHQLLKALIDVIGWEIARTISYGVIAEIVSRSRVKCLHLILSYNVPIFDIIISDCLLKYFTQSTAGLDHKHLIHQALFDQYMMIPRSFYNMVCQNMDPVTSNPMKESLLNQIDKYSSTPRTLVDFCRFKIRQLISCRLDFCEVVKSLDIHGICKEILMMERNCAVSTKLLPHCLSSDGFTEAQIERQYLVM